MKNYFKRVKEWNEMMGVKVPSKFNVPSDDDLELMQNLMNEEVQEMMDSKSKIDVLDSFSDQLFVMFGNMAKFGINYDEFKEYFVKVMKSNESKFANNEAQAIDSISKEANRLNLDPRSISYMEVNGKYVIFNVETGKILKSVNYVEPFEL